MDFEMLRWVLTAAGSSLAVVVAGLWTYSRWIDGRFGALVKDSDEQIFHIREEVNKLREEINRLRNECVRRDEMIGLNGAVQEVGRRVDSISNRIDSVLLALKAHS